VKNRGTVYSQRDTRSPANKRRPERRKWHKPHSYQEGGGTPEHNCTRKYINKRLTLG
tara:strand:- start:49 stop:219 length:171 start_codon:yes stop_codon:yes gene_type:complete